MSGKAFILQVDISPVLTLSDQQTDDPANTDSEIIKIILPVCTCTLLVTAH
jgi:hypothetical protein